MCRCIYNYFHLYLVMSESAKKNMFFSFAFVSLAFVSYFHVFINCILSVAVTFSLLFIISILLIGRRTSHLIPFVFIFVLFNVINTLKLLISVGVKMWYQRRIIEIYSDTQTLSFLVMIGVSLLGKYPVNLMELSFAFSLVSLIAFDVFVFDLDHYFINST